jgi:hypothetical protein
MEERIGGLIVLIASGAALAALLTLMVVLLPNLSNRTSRTMETMPGRSFLLGAVNFIFFSAVAFVLSQIGNGVGGFFGGIFSLTALFISIILLLLLCIGLAGLVRLIGERTNDGKPVSLGQLFRAAVLLVAAVLAPLAGWFVLAPLALFTGLGAAIIALVQWLGGRFSSRSPQDNQPRSNTK